MGIAQQQHEQQHEEEEKKKTTTGTIAVSGVTDGESECDPARTAIKPTHIAVSTPTSANSAGEYRWNPAAVESLFALSNALLGISSSAEFFSHCDSGFATEDGSSSRCSSSHSTTARQPNNDN